MKKTLLVFMFVASVFSSCNKLEINEGNILGTWYEDYSDYPYYAPDGGVICTFRADGKVDIHFYDVFAGDSDVRKTYLISNNELWLNPEMSDFSGEQYRIVKLTKAEMEWQRVGTTFSKGTVGSDFKHFVRSNRKE